MAVSNIGQRINDQFNILNLQSRVRELQSQISTGKKGDFFSDYTSLEATNSIIYRRSRAEFETYTRTIDTVSARIEVMDKSMTDIRDEADDTVAFLLSLVQDSDPQTNIITDEASQAIENVQNRLNTQFGDRYLFSGSDIANAPFDDAATLDANFNALVGANFGTGPTQAAVVAASRAVTGTNLGYSTTLGPASNVTARIDENTDIDYTVRADDQGFADILRGLSLVSNLPDPTNQAEQDDFWTIVNSAIELIQDGVQRVDELQGLNGNKAEQLADRRAGLEDLEGDFRKFIGQTEDTDIVKATLQLQDLDLQLQASYQVTAQSRQLSLVNFF